MLQASWIEALEYEHHYRRNFSIAECIIRPETYDKHIHMRNVADTYIDKRRRH